MIDFDSLQSLTADLNGNPLCDLRLNAVRAVLGAQYAGDTSPGSVQDDRRLAMIRAEWLAVAASLGLSVGNIASWMGDDRILRTLVEAFDSQIVMRQRGLAAIR